MKPLSIKVINKGNYCFVDSITILIKINILDLDHRTIFLIVKLVVTTQWSYCS